MDTKHWATTAAIVLVLARCASVGGLAVKYAWVEHRGMRVATLAAIYATAF